MKVAIGLFTLIFMISSIYGNSLNKKQSEDFSYQVLKKYSPTSYHILMSMKKMPSTFQVGQLDIPVTQIAFMQFIESTDKAGIIKDLNVAVHEMNHIYTVNRVYPILAEKGEDLKSANVYYVDGEDIFVERGEVFPSKEFADSVSSELRTMRFDGYIANADESHGTQMQGIYGLLDEFNSYYQGTKAVYDTLDFFYKEIPQTAENWINFYKGFYGTYFAYAEFRFFILKYLIYAKENQIETYEKIINNKQFKNAFNKVDKNFKKMIDDFNKKNPEILKYLNSKGMKASIEGEEIRIDNQIYMTYQNDFNKLMNEMKQSEYQAVLKALRK